MNNKELNNQLAYILSNKEDLDISKGTISGSSIEIKNTKTGEDIGSFVYYDRINKRDSDFNTLMVNLTISQ